MNHAYIPRISNVFCALFILGLPLLANADDISFSVPLAPNTWNLVSIPVDVPDESVAGVLGEAANSVDSIYTYTDQHWQAYHAGHPELSTLTALKPGFGYFVHTTSAATILGRGTLFSASSTPPTIALPSGWSLIGAFAQPQTTSLDIDSSFNSIGFSGVDYLALWKLDPSTGSFTTPDTVSQGDAFWILLDAPHTYAPSGF